MAMSAFLWEQVGELHLSAIPSVAEHPGMCLREAVAAVSSLGTAVTHGCTVSSDLLVRLRAGK